MKSAPIPLSKIWLLSGLVLILLFAPLAIRFFSFAEPIEGQFMLLRQQAKFSIEALIMIVMLGFLGHSGISKRPLILWSPLSMALLGLLVWSLISLFYSKDTGLTVRALIDLGSVIVLYLLVINICAETRYRNALLSFLLGLGVGLSIYGIYQYFFEFRYIHSLLDKFMAENPVNARWDLVRRSVLERRVSSTFGLHNMFASFLGMVIPLSLSFVWRQRNIRARLFLIAATAIMLSAMLLTFSIGGWLSLFIVLGIEGCLLLKASNDWQLLRPVTKRRWKIVFLVSLVVLVIVVSAAVGAKRASVATQSSFQSRWAYLLSSFKMVKDYFLLGSGWGSFASVYPKYILSGTSDAAVRYATLSAHNLYLQVLIETGIIGLLIFAFFIFRLVKHGWQKIISGPDEHARLTAIGVFSGVCFFLIHNLIDIGFYFFPVAVFWWFLVGITAHPATDLDLPTQSRVARTDILALTACSAFLLIIIVMTFSAGIYAYKGAVEMKHGRYAKSIAHFKTANKLEPFNSRILEKLGALFYVQRQWDQAIHYYQQASAYYPVNEEYRRFLCALFLNTNQLEEALAEYAALIKINPEDANNIFLGALVYERLGHRDLADKMYKDALTLNPNHPGALQKLR